MNPFDLGSYDGQIAAFEARIREASGPFADHERTQLERQIADLRAARDDVARERTRAQDSEAERQRAGELRQAAAKALDEHRRGQLASGVVVLEAEARSRALNRLIAAESLAIAAEQIAKRGLHPAHSKRLLEAYANELRAASADLAPHIERVIARGELPKFVSDEEMRKLEHELPVYTPPPPPPPAWPEPDPGYLERAAAVLEGLYAARCSATYQHPLNGRVEPMSADIYGSARSKESVLDAVARGAKLAWAPGIGRRLLPPAIEGFAGASWIEAPAADGYLLAFAQPTTGSRK